MLFLSMYVHGFMLNLITLCIHFAAFQTIILKQISDRSKKIYKDNSQIMSKGKKTDFIL